MRIVSHGIAILVILTLLAVCIVLFLPSMLPQQVQDIGHRIALGELLTGVAGVFALLLAAWEFRQSQRAPKLRLWMESRIEGNASEPTRVFVARCEYTREASVGTVYSFPFKLLLENYGDAPARWVKVSIRLQDSRHPVGRLMVPSSELRLSTKEYGFGKWASDENTRRPRWHVFHGGDDFIAYSRPKKVDSIRPWLGEIGHFDLKVPVSVDENEQEVVLALQCSLQADGFHKHGETLRFRIADAQ